MNKKDFSILLDKVHTTTGTRDVSMVTGFNAYAQYIENICKTQKGEIISDMSLGSDLYNYIFNGQANKGLLETSLAAYIKASVKTIFNVKVKLEYASETVFEFLVTYDVSDGINKISNASTFVEVEL